MIPYFAAAAVACVVAASGPAIAQDKLTVFWGKGFYKAEDDALFAAVKKFEEKAKVKVDISQYPPQDMNGCRAANAARPPPARRMERRSKRRARRSPQQVQLPNSRI